jgi:hypothetical protein
MPPLRKKQADTHLVGTQQINQFIVLVMLLRLAFQLRQRQARLSVIVTQRTALDRRTYTIVGKVFEFLRRVGARDGRQPRLLMRAWYDMVSDGIICHDMTWYQMVCYQMILPWYQRILLWYEMIFLWYEMILLWYEMILLWYEMILLWYEMVSDGIRWYAVRWYCHDMRWYCYEMILLWYDMLCYAMRSYSYDTIWDGMRWDDMIWYNMIWYNMIWWECDFGDLPPKVQRIHTEYGTRWFVVCGSAVFVWFVYTRVWLFLQK